MCSIASTGADDCKHLQLLALAGTPAFDQFLEEATNFLANHSK